MTLLPEAGLARRLPATWLELEDFQTVAAFVQGIVVISDHAERGVPLIQESNRSLTKDEEQLQFLLQVVSHHRAQFPDSKKKTVAAGVTARQEHQVGHKCFYETLFLLGLDRYFL